MSWLKSRLSKKTNRDFASTWARDGRVYILPTKFGVMFTLGAFFMLLIGSAYENNLVNLLGFFMLAILFTAMIATHNNIQGLVISRVEATHGFSGEELPVSMVVHNKTRSSKSNCDFTIKGFEKIAQYDARAVIEPGGDARLLASFKAGARGLHELRRFVLSTTAPFGLFYAWQFQPSDAIAVVYPTRTGDRPWRMADRSITGDVHRASGAEDYKEHVAYSAGDNLNRVDWKAFARGRDLLTKKFDEPVGEGLMFEYHRISETDPEIRLQQMAKWIDLAVSRGQVFTLTLPSKKLGPDQGLAFAHRAWTELAKYEEKI